MGLVKKERNCWWVYPRETRDMFKNVGICLLECLFIRDRCSVQLNTEIVITYDLLL